MAKKEYLVDLFRGIHKRYDLLNHVLSLYLDKGWRKALVEQVKADSLFRILDVCTGTCDLAMEFAKRYPGTKIIGIDISDQMLKIGLEKIKRSGLHGRIMLQQSDLFRLPFKDEVFDAVSIGFGFRNIHDFRSGIREMIRVLKRDGILLILELTLPQNNILKTIHLFYLKYVLPRIGGVISGSRYSYEYLSSSIIAFPKREEVLKLFEIEGLRGIDYKNLSGGIASIFTGKK